VLDVWLAKSSTPAPLAIYYHGGGFRAGDKRTLNRELLEKLRANGISVAAANYRLSNVAPYPAQMHDSARALQFLRLHAQRYNIDPTRVGAFGGSAGAGISQWLAFHNDLADPKNPDPVLRQSTRLSAIVPSAAQSSYDPRFIKKLMNTDQVHPALVALFGMSSTADVDQPRFFPLFEDSSPINHLTADDPPILLFYSQRNDPLPPNSTGEQHIHHPKFGFALKEKADRLGVPCKLILREDHPEGFPVDQFVEFFRTKLGGR
jgi:acetyl esterase/lipase